ncbi:MAG: butanol dehydrogenase, partial [Oscillospiraceae bacterium]
NKMNRSLDIPSCIKDYEGGIIDEKEFNDKLSKVATLALSDACTGSNPRIPTQEEMEKLLTAVYYDKEIDF